MFKLAVVVIFCLSVSAWGLNLHQYTSNEIREEDIAELFSNYLTWIAPSHLKLQATRSRYNYFRSQVLKIIEHNRNPEKTYTQTITKFTGLTLEELEGFAIMAPQNCSATNGISAVGLQDVPSYFDWRHIGVVTPVKDQGRCGSCWAFATIGSLEANWHIVKGSKSPSLSEQQLVDCAGDFNNFGCNGGLPSQAFEYIKHVGGIQTGASYPYTAKDEKCAFDARQIAVTVPYGSANITMGDEDALLEAVFTQGPVSIAYEVTSDFTSYGGGVYVGKTCRKDTQHVNHAVLAVGFGFDAKNDLKYWIVKNSWGTSWGESGYFRIERGTNMCGLAVCASYPQIRQPK